MITLASGPRPAPAGARPDFLPAGDGATPVELVEAEALPARMLADIASGFAAARPLWSAVVRHEPDGRRPVRLIATERYEVWVIGWTTGQSVRVHDHGDSAGAPGGDRGRAHRGGAARRRRGG